MDLPAQTIKKKKKSKEKCEQRQSFPLTFPPPCPAPSLTQTSGKSLDCPSLHNHTCPQLLLLLPHPIPPASLSSSSSPSLSPHPPTVVAKLMTSSRLPGTTLWGCSLRRALVSAAWGRGRLILGRLVRCSPFRICCLASSRTRARSPWGARVGPPQDGHADLVLCTHANAHRSTGQRWTSESPMPQVDGPELRASDGSLTSQRGQQ